MKNTNKIIITAKEWFDRINGNSYFAAKIELENETLLLCIPFSYGYGDSCYDATIELLCKENYIPNKCTAWDIRRYCRENNIIFSYGIQRKCLKRELNN